MSAQRAVGVDVGGKTVAAGVVGGDGPIARLERHATPLESTRAPNAASVAAAR